MSEKIHKFQLRWDVTFSCFLNFSDESLQALDSCTYDDINLEEKSSFSRSEFVLNRTSTQSRQRSKWEKSMRGDVFTADDVAGLWWTAWMSFQRVFFFLSRPFGCTISAGGKTPICSRPLSILSQLRAIKTAECQRAARRGSEETEESN